MLKLDKLPVRANSLTFALVLLTLAAISVAIWVPLRPSFPVGTLLDDSWIIGLNEAAGLGLSIGHDIVFTFGPYASVHTEQYHRATDSLMLLGSTVMAVGFTAVLWAFAWLRRPTLPVVVGALLLIFFDQRDALLLSYPLLVFLFVYARYVVPPQHRRPLNAPVDLALLCVLLFPFGLLPLTKGSTLLSVAGTTLLCAAAMSYVRRKAEAVLCVAVPVIACTLLWLITGQPLADLFLFFSNLLPIILGYTTAMSLGGPPAEIAIYLIASSAFTVAVLSTRSQPLQARLFLLAGFGLMLFCAFKAGFVRHDAHAVMAASAVGIAGCFLLLAPTRMAGAGLVIGFTAWALISSQYGEISTASLVRRSYEPFISLLQGFDLRLTKGSDELERVFRAQGDALAKECPIDQLDDSVDIYSFRQSCLIFSGNKWAPRPVFQGYSAYTPRLAEMNAAHLLGDTAPGYVLFRIEPIDQRLPSLDDGPSWPLLFQLYRPLKLDSDLLYLKRKNEPGDVSRPTYKTIVFSVGKSIRVPAHEGAMMARVRLSPTMLGRFVNFAFKTPSPQIVVTLQNGAVREFRFVPGIAAAEFLLSPLVTNTRDFLLAMEKVDAMQSTSVRSFRIELGEQGSWFWSNAVEVSFSQMPIPSSGTHLAFDQRVAEPPANGMPATTTVCDGYIDQINGITPVPVTLDSGPVIALNGWTAVSARHGELPDEVYVVVRTEGAAPAFFHARSVPRPDVAVYFGQPQLRASGFQSYIDLDGIGPEVTDVTLHLAQVTAGRLTFCEPFRHIRMSNWGLDHHSGQNQAER